MANNRKITAKRAKRKPRGKPFVKGDPRANVDGRPPLTMEDKEFKELCRAKAPEAVKRIENISKGKGMTAYKANEYIVDRAYGKPKQETAVSVNAGSAGGLVIMLPPLKSEE